MYQFWQIHVTTKRNPCNNFDSSNNLNRILIKSLRYFLFYHKYIFVGSECHYWIYQIAIHSSIVNTKIISAMSKKTTIYIKPNFSEKRVKGQPLLLTMVPLTLLVKPYITLLSIADKPRHPQHFAGKFSWHCFAHHLSHDSYPAGRTRFEGR